MWIFDQKKFFPFVLRSVNEFQSQVGIRTLSFDVVNYICIHFSFLRWKKISEWIKNGMIDLDKIPRTCVLSNYSKHS